MTVGGSAGRRLREIRLALVMNGGVSLAVWMSGVTHEIDECRLAADEDEDDRPRPVRAAWRKILDAVDARITVDLIAGTSAGGLNGTVLATAVANQRRLPDLRALWLDRATVTAGKLLPTTPDPTASVLDGVFFRDEVLRMLAEVGAGAPASDPAPLPTVSLLVTATALPIADTDDAVAEVVRDSRRVYRFTARPGAAAFDVDGQHVPELPAQSHFAEPPQLATLAEAARASAGFPAAFQPTQESAELAQHRKGGGASRGRWLMDGGVLDNAPFEPLLDELRQRAVSGRFTRWVVDINPSADAVRRRTFSPEGAGKGSPTLLGTLGAFVSATREPDRRLDVEGIDDALNAARYAPTDPDRVLADLFRSGGDPAITPATLAEAAIALFPQYRANRRHALFVTAVPKGVLRPAPRPPGALPDAPLLVPAERLLGDGDWHWGLSTADRILRWWGRALSTTAPGPGQAEAYALLGPAQRRIQAWGDGFDRAVGDDAGDVRRWVAAAEGYLGEHRLPAVAAAVLRTAATPMAVALGAPTGAALLQASLDLEIVNRAMSWRNDAALDVPRFVFWRLTPAAPEPFPLELSDQERLDWPHHKLYGERWGHFGAFASRDGRSWDWLWGRLDAAMTLSSRLLADSPVSPERAKELQDRLVAAIVTEEDQDPDRVRRKAAAMLALTQHGLWDDYRAQLDEPTRGALLDLADRLPGALVPQSWPIPIHAVVDDPGLWAKHQPRDPKAVQRLAFHRGAGRLARWIARRRLRRMLTLKVPHDRSD